MALPGPHEKSNKNRFVGPARARPWPWALAPWALGPMGPGALGWKTRGPWALPAGPCPWAHGPWAQGPFI